MDTAAGFPDSVLALTGEPAAIRDSGTAWSAFARTATEASEDLRGLDADTFVGDEGDLYRSRINTNLPPYLDTTADAWSRVAAAVTTYGRTLADLQTELAGLRSAAYHQWIDATTATAAAADAGWAAADTHPADDDAADRARATATATAAAAHAEFQATLDRTAGIRARHAHAVDACVAGIDHARDLRFADPPGWFGRLWQSACDWVADHVDVLQALSAVLKQISGIAAMLTWIPVVGPLAGAVAVTAGGLAVGIDATVKLATGEGDWAQIGIDALSMVPGARAAKAVLVADTTITAVQVDTGDISVTDAAIALASTAGLARFRRSASPETSAGIFASGSATYVMGRTGRKPPPPDPDEQRWRDTVPASSFLDSGHDVRYSRTCTAVGNDIATIQNFLRSRGRDGWHDVVAHGGQGEFRVSRSGAPLHPQQMADTILANPDYAPGCPIRLVTCFGATGPAQELAAILGVEVEAFAATVQLDSLTGELKAVCDL